MRVRSISHRAYQGPVFDLNVDKAHAYYANGIRVHNCHCRIDFDRDELMERARLGTLFDDIEDGSGDPTGGE